MKWIDVKQELPPKELLVLTVQSHGGMRITYWSRFASGEQHPGVTHWMPLPAPPAAPPEGETDGKATV